MYLVRFNKHDYVVEVDAFRVEYIELTADADNSPHVLMDMTINELTDGAINYMMHDLHRNGISHIAVYSANEEIVFNRAGEYQIVSLQDEIHDNARHVAVIIAINDLMKPSSVE